MIDVCLAGTGAMMPLPGRWLSSLILRTGPHSVVFDCGEGTQIALRSLGCGLRSIDAICISHFHADHVSGLVGMLLMLANSDRTEPVTLFGPPGLLAVVEGQRRIAPFLPFELLCEELAPGAQFRVADWHGSCAAGVHHVPCLAYRLDLPRRPAFLPERAKALGLPVELWGPLQHGTPVEWGGRVVRPEEVLGPPRRGISIAYVTDTRPTPPIAVLVAGVDLLVCEGTFGDPAEQARAVETGHMTFAEAAELAKKAGVRRLWLTHFSPAMPRPREYAAEAQRRFPNVTIGWDGLCTTLSYEDSP